jgi:hypothetical protein
VHLTHLKPASGGSKSKDSGSKSKDSGSKSKDSGSKSKDSGSKSKDSKSKSKDSGKIFSTKQKVIFHGFLHNIYGTNLNTQKRFISEVPDSV